MLEPSFKKSWLPPVFISIEKKKDKLKVILKAVHRLALGIKLQKGVISNQKQPSCKKGYGLQKVRVKKDVKSKVAAKK